MSVVHKDTCGRSAHKKFTPKKRTPKEESASNSGVICLWIKLWYCIYGKKNKKATLTHLKRVLHPPQGHHHELVPIRKQPVHVHVAGASQVKHRAIRVGPPPVHSSYRRKLLPTTEQDKGGWDRDTPTTRASS